MPAKDDGITKRKDGRYMVRFSVHCPGEAKWILIYGRRPKSRRVAEALGVEPH